MVWLRHIVSRTFRAIRQLFESRPKLVRRRGLMRDDYTSISSGSSEGPEKRPSSIGLEDKDDDVAELYVVYANDVSVKSQADAINQLLNTLVSDKSAIYASEVNDKVNGKDMWTLFWGVTLTASQAQYVKADPNSQQLQLERHRIPERQSMFAQFRGLQVPRLRANAGGNLLTVADENILTACVAVLIRILISHHSSKIRALFRAYMVDFSKVFGMQPGIDSPMDQLRSWSKRCNPQNAR
ncbi:MAG: hypothetical protein Q9204_003949 [Flavoplaca sp. TL-2023a]